MPAQWVTGYGIGHSIDVSRNYGDRPLRTCKPPGHAVDEAIRCAHVIPALRESEVGATAHRGGGVAFTTAIARRHECRMAAGGVRGFPKAGISDAWKLDRHFVEVVRRTSMRSDSMVTPEASGGSERV